MCVVELVGGVVVGKKFSTSSCISFALQISFTANAFLLKLYGRAQYWPHFTFQHIPIHHIKYFSTQ